MRKSFSALLLILCSLPIFCNLRTYASDSANLRIINPLTENEYFNFTSLNKNINDTFNVNVTVENVINLGSWQTAISWDPSILEWVNVTLPGFIFMDFPPQPDYENGTLIFGNALGPRQPGQNGSVLLFNIGLRILKAGQTNITFKNPSIDTFLAATNASGIPFSMTNGFFSYKTILSADVNNDGIVNMTDIMLLVQAFNSYTNSPRWNASYDLNQDGRIDIRDIMISIHNFGRSS